MTSALRKAWDEVKKLPPKQQDTMAAIILDELASERKWDELFASEGSQRFLERMSEHVMEEHRQGRTRPLDELLSASPTRSSRQERSRPARKRAVRSQGHR